MRAEYVLPPTLVGGSAAGAQPDLKKSQMPKISPEQLAHEWGRLLTVVSREVHEQVYLQAKIHQTTLATCFYQQMLQDAVVSQFLSHQQVQERLHSSMQRWITTVFSVHHVSELLPVVTQQIHIGEVHARIGIPVHLVLRGARCLKEKFIDLLYADTQLSADHTRMAVRFVTGVIDTAVEIMSQTYSSANERNARAEEAYRLFSVSQHVGAERERQRAALLAWENQLMFEQAIGGDGSHLPRLGTSEFGLWFRHKGAHAFHGSSEAAMILAAIDRMDDVLLPMLSLAADAPHADRMQCLHEFRDATRGIAYHLNSLFEQNNELEAGRDVLTRLLNRKFLSVVLNKEINFAQQHKSCFALLSIDIDYFKLVNDQYGHEAGDMVLQQISSILINNSRGGDYIFRMGGEEFLLLLVDINMGDAIKIAEKLRKQVERESFRLPIDKTMQLTISIGLAVYNGHPDYQQVLRQADAALYRAKNSGRNRVVHLDN